MSDTNDPSAPRAPTYGLQVLIWRLEDIIASIQSIVMALPVRLWEIASDLWAQVWAAVYKFKSWVESSEIRLGPVRYRPPSELPRSTYDVAFRENAEAIAHYVHIYRADDRDLTDDEWLLRGQLGRDLRRLGVDTAGLRNLSSAHHFPAPLEENPVVSPAGFVGLGGLGAAVGGNRAPWIVGAIGVGLAAISFFWGNYRVERLEAKLDVATAENGRLADTVTILQNNADTFAERARAAENQAGEAVAALDETKRRYEAALAVDQKRKSEEAAKRRRTEAAREQILGDRVGDPDEWLRALAGPAATDADPNAGAPLSGLPPS